MKLLMSVCEGEQYINVDFGDVVINNRVELSDWVYQSLMFRGRDIVDVLRVMDDCGVYLIETSVKDGFDVEEMDSSTFMNEVVIEYYDMMVGVS